VDIPFDPFSLEILPPIRPDTPKANLFIAGMLLNRISYHFVETALFAKNKFLEIELDFESVIHQKIANLDNRLQQLQQYDQRLEDGLRIFFKKLDDLESQCERVQKERKKNFDLLPKRRLPDPSEFNWHAGTGYPLADAGVKVSELCFNLAEKLKNKQFRAGSLVDRFTHGTGSDTQADYCYSHLPVVQKKRGGNPEIVWCELKGDHSCDWRTHISDGDWSFFKRFNFDGKSQKAPYLVSNQTGSYPTPTEWANAVTAMWGALVRWDKPYADFNQISVSGGKVLKNGEVVASFPPKSQLPKAINYIIEHLKKDPSASFSNAKIKEVVNSDDDRFSISNLFRPNKAGKNHFNLAYFIRPITVRGEDGLEAVTLEIPDEYHVFWRSADSEIDRVRQSNQQESK